MIWIIVAIAVIVVIFAVAWAVEWWQDRQRENEYEYKYFPIQPEVGEFAYPGWTALKWYEQRDGTDLPVFIALHQVVGIYPSDVGSEDESLTVHLANGSHVYTNHQDTIERFWNTMEIV
jgi:hypothetical protein